MYDFSSVDILYIFFAIPLIKQNTNLHVAFFFDSIEELEFWTNKKSTYFTLIQLSSLNLNKQIEQLESVQTKI